MKEFLSSLSLSDWKRDEMKREVMCTGSDGSSPCPSGEGLLDTGDFSRCAGELMSADHTRNTGGRGAGKLTHSQRELSTMETALDSTVHELMYVFVIKALDSTVHELLYL